MEVQLEVQQICEDLFRETGQIGYYLLKCRLSQEGEESRSGAVSACARDYFAQSGL